MWPKRPKTPRVARSIYSCYLRGKLVAARIGEEGEGALYASDNVPMALRVAFALGATSKRRAPVMSESEVDQAVRDRLDLSAMVAEVEGGDDPGSSTPPPVVRVLAEQTVRLQVRAIGDPLPSTSS